jgi:hypothetical protein
MVMKRLTDSAKPQRPLLSLFTFPTLWPLCLRNGYLVYEVSPHLTVRRSSLIAYPDQAEDSLGIRCFAKVTLCGYALVVDINKHPEEREKV